MPLTKRISGLERALGDYKKNRKFRNAGECILI
jgi:hypothetical protein